MTLRSESFFIRIKNGLLICCIVRLINFKGLSVYDQISPDKNESRKRWLVSDLILSIEYLKALPFFNELDSLDREFLAIYTCFINLAVVQSFYSYLHNSKTLLLPTGVMPMLSPVGKNDFYAKKSPRFVYLWNLIVIPFI